MILQRCGIVIGNGLGMGNHKSRYFRRMCQGGRDIVSSQIAVQEGGREASFYPFLYFFNVDLAR